MKGSAAYYGITPSANKMINEAIFSHSEKLLIYYAKEYQERPRELIGTFLNNNSFRMAVCLVIFTCRKNGLLKELEGQKDFNEWVSKQKIEEKWKPVLEKFLLILWGIIK